MPSYHTSNDFPIDEIYVIDTETTGLIGAPKDLVVDIGITRVSLKKCIVEDVYSSVLGYDIGKWSDYYLDAWIFKNTDLTLDMITKAPSATDVIEKVRHILYGKAATSYNVAYDMDKFLYQNPWNMRGMFITCNDIMKAAAQVCKLPSKCCKWQYRYPRLEYAYKKIVKGDLACINGTQNHRALSDAKMASYLMIQMFNDRMYNPCKWIRY